MERDSKTNKNKVNIKSNKGVTLLVLGITIVVLSILAGITISMLTNDHGIIDEATSTAIQTETSKVQEEWELYVKSKQLKRVRNKDYSKPTAKEGLA